MLHCIQSIWALVCYNTSLWGENLQRHNFINIPVKTHIKPRVIWCINQSSTTRIAQIHSCCQFPHTSTGCLPPPTVVLVGGGGGGSDGRGAARLHVLQVAGVAEKVAVQRVAAVTLLVVQLHLTVLNDTQEETRHPLTAYMSVNRRKEDNWSDFCSVLTSFPSTDILDSSNYLWKCAKTAFRTGSFLHLQKDLKVLADIKYVRTEKRK